MYEEWVELRNELIFDAAPGNFQRRCEAARARYSGLFAKADDVRKEEIAQLMADIAVDLVSYLPRWRAYEDESQALPDQELIKESEAFLSLVKKLGYNDKAISAVNETGALKESKLIKLTELAAQQKINNYWGNDNGIGIMEAMRRGAALVTTNPPIVNMAREARPDVFDRVRDNINAHHKDEPVERRVTRLTFDVVRNNARALRPIYLITKGKLGYVNFQVSPLNSKDSDAMVEEAEFAYGLLAESLGGKPNVVFKVPGTYASLEAVRRLTAEGIGINITVNFSVPQCIAFSEAIESGKADLSYMTVMAGRLDGPVCDDLKAKNIDDAEKLSKNASRLVTQRAYNDVIVKNGLKHVELLIASLRGSWNFDASITSNRASKIVISSFPDKAAEYDADKGEIVPLTDVTVPQETIERLKNSDVFRKAYEPDAMKPEEFDDYLPVQKTLGQFIGVYEGLKEYMRLSDEK